MDKKILLPADILWVCDSFYRENYKVKPHAHLTYYHLVCVREGTCTAEIFGKKYKLSPGMIMLAMPEDVHSINKDEEIEEVKFWEVKFIVNSRVLTDALKKTDRVFVAGEFEQELLSDIIQNSYGTGNYINLNAVRIYLSALLFHICGEEINSSGQENVSRYLQGIDTSDFSKATIETVQYIELNYMNDISLEIIGKAIGYYKNYISTVVKRDLSINVGELIYFIRIQKAAELLYYSDYDLKQIYSQTGFKNINHFTRVFKKMVGIPPAQYRRSFPEGTLEIASQVLNGDASIPMWINGLLRDYIDTRPN